MQWQCFSQDYNAYMRYGLLLQSPSHAILGHTELGQVLLQHLVLFFNCHFCLTNPIFT